MPNWFSNNVLDGGLKYVYDNATELWLIFNYTYGDDYATVEQNYILLWQTLTQANMAFSNGTNSVNGNYPSKRVLTIQGNNMPGEFSFPGSATPGIGNLSYALTNGLDEILLVTGDIYAPAWEATNIIVPDPIVMNSWQPDG